MLFVCAEASDMSFKMEVYHKSGFHSGRFLFTMEQFRVLRDWRRRKPQLGERHPSDNGPLAGRTVCVAVTALLTDSISRRVPSPLRSAKSSEVSTMGMGVDFRHHRVNNYFVECGAALPAKLTLFPPLAFIRPS
jgi:hypothetical protein